MAELILATPVLRGNSDVITNYDVEATVEAGTAVSLDSNAFVSKFDGSKELAGVAGFEEIGKRQSVIKAALGVAVKIEADATPVIGEKVYVDEATGLFTSNDAKTPTRATWASEKGDAVNPRTNTIVANCAAIDFIGGLNG